MSWALCLEKPWVQSKHILLLSTGIAFGLYLQGYSHPLMIGSLLLILVVLVIIPGHLRFGYVRAATAILEKSSSEERKLSDDELYTLVQAIVIAGRLEFRRENQLLIDEILPDDPILQELINRTEKSPHGESRRLVGIETQERLQICLHEVARAQAREAMEARRQVLDEHHAKEKADRLAKVAKKEEGMDGSTSNGNNSNLKIL